MRDLLSGRAALVTGAGTRVGAAVARALGAEGMRVAVHYHRSAQGAEATCRAIAEAGGEAFPVRADLTDRAAARDLVDRVVERLGGLDLLVPSAANFERVPVDDVDDAAWDRAMALNLGAPFAMAHQARDALRASEGAIVFITCASTARPFRGHLPYLVSKAGVRQLMRALALELAPRVRVNAVAPGTVLPPPDASEEEVTKLVRDIPLARVGSAEDVADAVVYLAGARFITGHEFRVDGGSTL